MDRFEEAYKQYRNEQLGPLDSVQPVNQDSKESIMAVRRNDDGNIIGIKTDSGRELDYPHALQEAKDGNIANVDVFHKYGRDILRSEPDGIKENNLHELPDF